jgi:hypothetical protein
LAANPGSIAQMAKSPAGTSLPRLRMVKRD